MATDRYGVKFPDGTTNRDLDAYETARQRLIFGAPGSAKVGVTVQSAAAGLAQQHISLPDSGAAVPVSLANPGLGRWYTEVRHKGNSLLLTGSNGGYPCNSLQYATLYDPWNNVLDSQILYPECSSARMWDNQNYTGDQYLASGSTQSYGSYNNRPSAMRIQSAG